MWQKKRTRRSNVDEVWNERTDGRTDRRWESNLVHLWHLVAIILIFLKLKHCGSFPIGWTPGRDRHNGQKETNERTNERTDGRRDATLRPSVRLLDGVWHLYQILYDCYTQRLYSICLYSATCKSVQHQCTQMTHRSLRAKLRLEISWSKATQIANIAVDFFSTIP